MTSSSVVPPVTSTTRTLTPTIVTSRTSIPSNTAPNSCQILPERVTLTVNDVAVTVTLQNPWNHTARNIHTRSTSHSFTPLFTNIPTVTPAYNPSPTLGHKSHTRRSIIAGGVVGGVVLVLLLGVVAGFCGTRWQRRRRREIQLEQSVPTPYPHILQPQRRSEVMRREGSSVVAENRNVPSTEEMGPLAVEVSRILVDWLQLGYKRNVDEVDELGPPPEYRFSTSS